jgi:hypothetical protein
MVRRDEVRQREMGSIKVKVRQECLRRIFDSAAVDDPHVRLVLVFGESISVTLQHSLHICSSTKTKQGEIGKGECKTREDKNR